MELTQWGGWHSVPFLSSQRGIPNQKTNLERFSVSYRRGILDAYLSSESTNSAPKPSAGSSVPIRGGRTTGPAGSPTHHPAKVTRAVSNGLLEEEADTRLRLTIS